VSAATVRNTFALISRKFRYDESVEEYFVQTADTIKVKKSELEAYQKMETQDAEKACPLVMCSYFSCASGVFFFLVLLAGVASAGAKAFNGTAQC
jgi:hypothetical protein